MKLLSRIFVLSAVLMAVCACNTDSEAGPIIDIGDIEVVPWSGGTRELTVNFTNADDKEVYVMADGTVVLDAICHHPERPVIVYTVSENNTSEMREGFIFVMCGNTVEQIIILQEGIGRMEPRSGWFELPAVPEDENLLYYAHSKLPSDHSKRNYSFLYAPEHYAALWVAYPLHDCYLGNAGRTDKFYYDNDFAAYSNRLGMGGLDIQSNVSAGSFYSEEGLQLWDRGHQLPSADRTVSSADNRTTFYATNMTPQRNTLNQQMWEKLEENVREWRGEDTLYVVTGAVFGDDCDYAYDGGGKSKTGSKQVCLPEYYYKVLLRTKESAEGKCVADCTADELKCIGFWVKNESRSGKTVYFSDACSVEEVEQRTGMTFFVNVPNAPKGTYDTSEWPDLTAD